MKNIRDLVEKPSQAVRLMTKGLRNPGNISVDMHSFGNQRRGVCFGCAATCTVQQLMSRTFELKDFVKHTESYEVQEVYRRNKWSELSGITIDSIAEFEWAIDDLRKGKPSALFDLFNVSEPYGFEGLPVLNSDFTEEHLLRYDAYADQLEALGL